MNEILTHAPQIRTNKTENERLCEIANERCEGSHLHHQSAHNCQLKLTKFVPDPIHDETSDKLAHTQGNEDKSFIKIESVIIVII